MKITHTPIVEQKFTVELTESELRTLGKIAGNVIIDGALNAPKDGPVWKAHGCLTDFYNMVNAELHNCGLRAVSDAGFGVLQLMKIDNQ